MAVGNVEFEELIHATVLLIRGRQTHCQGVSLAATPSSPAFPKVAHVPVLQEKKTASF